MTAPDAPPAAVESEFLGRLEFTDGYPTDPTLARLYDALDYQRAVQVLLRNLAGHSMHCFRTGLERDLGVIPASAMAIFTADAHSLMLTPNSDTLYGTTFLRLDVDGPTVFEAPPHMIGLVDDMWMRPIEDIGASGPDGGQGGKYLFVPPGYEGPLPDSGYFVIHSRTYGAWMLLRALMSPDGDVAPARALLEQAKIYPLSAAADAVRCRCFRMNSTWR